ncbi:MAG TPA: hypothetical protein VFT43_01675, partial [Candidatus Polarisedimenticolia bacterium]|nr:hypothetical protein [Candidatus Polarisedimenticolia bacterium]
MSAPSSGRSGPESTIILTLFACYAFFFQGGGWNQNSRLDQVRALAETGSLSIHEYMTFVPSSGADGRTVPRRIPLSAVSSLQGARPVYNTGDVAAVGGGIYPNKPPGVTFLAVPVYWLVWRVERLFGIDPDGWRVATVGAYLTTLLSIGLIGALAGALFYRASLSLFPSIPPACHAGATLVFSLGTLMFPFSTLLFDHVPVAFLSLLAFYLLQGGREAGGGSAVTLSLAAGLVAGAAVLCNYDAILTVALLIGYLATGEGAGRRIPLFLAGGLIPALELAAYHLACFGNPLTLATSYQSALFRDPQAGWLGAFGLPEPHALAGILVSPYRGLFFSSPVLLLALYGLGWMWRNARRREALLCGAVCVAFVTMNAAFRQWHAGSTFGPRYLVPALPFLALPLAPAIQRLPRLALSLGLLSFAMMLTATAVDPQVPFDVPRPWGDYLLPLSAGRTVTFPRYRVEGPVSANPQGVSEGYPYEIFEAGSKEAAWNSFNLGELLAPRSRLSLVP